MWRRAGGDGVTGGDGQRRWIGGNCANPSGEMCNCTAVDILSVVDSSSSMVAHQQALGEAFPQFAAAIDDALPPGTSVPTRV